jgi:XTP/dITP diphosphohydrolase
VRIYLASGNNHKVGELRELVRAAGSRVEILSAQAMGGMPAVVEDAGTFAGNARKKAQALRERLPHAGWVLADDSGLCVDALGGAPGVESAYFSGPQGDGAANLAKLITVMRPIPDGARQASFVCVLHLISPDGSEQGFEGRCPGTLLHDPRGDGGFGYDPLFVPEGQTLSFGELGEKVKNEISHRARAWRLLDGWLRSPLRQVVGGAG